MSICETNRFGSLEFVEQAPVEPSNPNRTDVACFVGFVRPRSVDPPSAIEEWLKRRGWTSPEVGSSVHRLYHVPVPIDSWEAFDALFDWDSRVIRLSEVRKAPDLSEEAEPPEEEKPAEEADLDKCTTYMGAAVRSFFAGGGRRCYVVSVGDPLPVQPATSPYSEDMNPSDRDAVDLKSETERETQVTDRLSDLAPGYNQTVLPIFPVDQDSWKGIGVLCGLPDVSFLCLPDLCDIVGDKALSPTLPDDPEIPEQFVECYHPEPEKSEDARAIPYGAPRCDVPGYGWWAQVVRQIGRFLAEHRREVQLVAAVPIPQLDEEPDANLLKFLIDNSGVRLLTPINENSGQKPGLASSFIQLVYPWVRTITSTSLPGQLESPDGVLVGRLAYGSLTNGAFRTVAGFQMPGVLDMYPSLSRSTLLTPYVGKASTGGTDKPENETEKESANLTWLRHVSMLGPTPDGLQVLSDVTTSSDEDYRQASVNRLVSLIVRAARRLGEDIVFENSGPRLWARVTDGMGRLLEMLLRNGALYKPKEGDAYRVECGRSTMTQNDIDNGRLITRVQFTPTSILEQITIVLGIDKSRRTSQTSSSASPGEGL